MIVVKSPLEIMKILVNSGYTVHANGTWTGPGLSFSAGMWQYCGTRVFKKDEDGDYIKNGYYYMPKWVEEK
jgi:hypothetical protein